MKANHTFEIQWPGRLRKIAMRCRIFVTMCTLLLLVPFCAAQGSSDSSQTVRPPDPNKIIYVGDFDLDANNFKVDKGGITGKGYLVPAPPKNFLRREHQDPATEAGNMVSLMSETLVADLEKKGFTARRLLAGEPRPTDGLLVSGVFTELSEGNQMRRALLGFGSGKAKIQLYVMLVDPSCDPQPVFETSAQTSSGKKPGTMVALNPYFSSAGFIAKFGMTKNAPEKMVKKTASKIADQLARQLHSDL
jgi:hypothetical protein